MAINLDLENLGSRLARKAIGSNGVRRFAANGLQQKRDDQENIVQKVWNGFSRFGGFLVSKVISTLVSGVSFTLSLIWSTIVSLAQFIFTFNWNASDQDLDRQISSGINSLGGMLGGTLGSAMGWLACGVLPGTVIFAFNEPMGAYVLKEVGEEALEELAGNVANLVRMTFITGAKATVTWLYKNIRRIWREPDSNFVKRLKSQGMNTQQIQKQLAERNKPWSLAMKLEETVEAIPNEFLRNFVEEFLEESAEACIEAGYVVANSVDSFIAQQKLANDGMLGEEKTVEILFNRESDRTQQVN